MKKLLPPLTLLVLATALVASPKKLSAEEYYLIPMDNKQVNHLRAYGATYKALELGLLCKWLLNYEGGSFLIPKSEDVLKVLANYGVTFATISEPMYRKIKALIAKSNMQEVVLEKQPRVAIYIPPNEDPWADAVTTVMTYAKIPFTKVYDKEVLLGELTNYDWLHLHHEDFTGYSSKYMSQQNSTWHKIKMATARKEAIKAGFKSVPEHKKAVAQAIQLAVAKGLFLFAMCTATDTIDISLATAGIDVADRMIDGTPVDPKWRQKIDYTKTFAFEDFVIYPDPYYQSFSDIDYNQMNTPYRQPQKDFILAEFSAKIDPIPTLLNQNHQNQIKAFAGQTTSFRTNKIKDGVTILATTVYNSAKYITGNYGKGKFTFYGGHEPEDPQHTLGETDPDLNKFRNSPGYRLILNNVLFPSAKPPPKKT